MGRGTKKIANHWTRLQRLSFTLNPSCTDDAIKKRLTALNRKLCSKCKWNIWC